MNKITPAVPEQGPRLLDLKAAEAYTGLSYWTLRALAEGGIISRVLIPDPRVPGRHLRRILFNRATLDAFISAHETAGRSIVELPGRKLKRL